jgi:hypothetical protein
MYIRPPTVDDLRYHLPRPLQGSAMPEITTEQLEAHLDHIETSNQDDKDELLRDLLVHVYPTKVTQDC